MKTLSRALMVCISATLLSAMATSAQAITFTGTSSATFGVPTPSSGILYGGVGTNEFWTGEVAYGGDPNILRIDGLPFSTPENVAFPVAELTYTNGQTWEGTTAESVPVDFQLALTSPVVFAPTFTFEFVFNMTPNTTGDPVLDADTLYPVDVFSSTNFMVGGDPYTLQLLGFSSDGGVTFEDHFTLPEDQTTVSLYMARITATPPELIPEPLTLLGVVFGLGSLGRYLRRRNTLA